MNAPSLRNTLHTGVLLSSAFLASIAVFAESAKPVIPLNPGATPGAVSVAPVKGEVPFTKESAKPVISLDPDTTSNAVSAAPVKGEATFAKAPENFHVFSSARVGENADVEQLRLRFSATTEITKIKSTTEFRIVGGGSCIEEDFYSAGDSCILLIRFTPQGAGSRLGKLTITHSASAEPLSIGLGGYGYVPVLSFTPAVISTVPGTYPSSVGLLSGATGLSINGSDTLYVADTGNNAVRYLDSSGTWSTLTTSYTAPLGITTDTFGEVYFDLQSSNLMYEVYDYGPVVQITGTGTAACTAAAPCNISSEALITPGLMTTDGYNRLFFAEGHSGAAMVTAQPVPATLAFLYEPFLYQEIPTAPIGVDTSDNLYSPWANGGLCEIVQSSLYSAENNSENFTKIAGGHTCGFSGDGGQAGNAEIGSTIGGFAFDLTGNLYFSDTANQRVRRIDDTTGIITTIAGTGTAGYSGDDGAATSAKLSSPTGVAVDSQGQVYIISSTAATGTAQVIRKLGPNGILSFSSQLKGTTSTAKTITVSNTGNSELTLTNAVIEGTDPSDFTIDPNTTSCLLSAGSILDSGQSCKVGILFKPSAAGSRTASLVFLDNTVTNSNTVLLSGTGTSPAPAISLSPSPLTFPPTAPGATATLPITVKNTGTANLTVTAIAFTGTNASSFSQTNNCTSAAIAAAGTCTVEVSFKPSAAGSYTATMQITDNAPASPQSLTVNGTSTGSASAVSLSPSPLIFTATTSGTTATLPVTVKNTGTANLTVTAIAFTGTNASSFSHTSNCGGGTLIAPGSSCTAQVKFKPSAAGSYTATMQITDNAPNSPQSLNITATGTAADVVLPIGGTLHLHLPHQRQEPIPRDK